MIEQPPHDHDLDLSLLVVSWNSRDATSSCIAAALAALDQLAEAHPEKAELVKLRYFAGLTADQAAAALGISPSTADRHWAYARAWLRRAMSDPE